MAASVEGTKRNGWAYAFALACLVCLAILARSYLGIGESTADRVFLNRMKFVLTSLKVGTAKSEVEQHLGIGNPTSGQGALYPPFPGLESIFVQYDKQNMVRSFGFKAESGVTFQTMTR